MLTLKIKVIGYELEFDRVSSFEFIWDLPFCLKNLFIAKEYCRETDELLYISNFETLVK